LKIHLDSVTAFYAYFAIFPKLDYEYGMGRTKRGENIYLNLFCAVGAGIAGAK